jgi:hypothetical protein
MLLPGYVRICHGCQKHPHDLGVALLRGKHQSRRSISVNSI